MVWSLANRSRKSARKMGLGEAYVGNPDHRDIRTLWEVINARKPAIFRRALPVAAFDALIRTLALHLVFTDQAARAVKAGMTPTATEGVMLVLDRRRQLHPAARIAAVVPGLVRRRACRRCYGRAVLSVMCSRSPA